jgi:hypothetical protein
MKKHLLMILLVIISGELCAMDEQDKLLTKWGSLPKNATQSEKAGLLWKSWQKNNPEYSKNQLPQDMKKRNAFNKKWHSKAAAQWKMNEREVMRWKFSERIFDDIITELRAAKSNLVIGLLEQRHKRNHDYQGEFLRQYFAKCDDYSVPNKKHEERIRSFAKNYHSYQAYQDKRYQSVRKHQQKLRELLRQREQDLKA